MTTLPGNHWRIAILLLALFVVLAIVAIARADTPAAEVAPVVVTPAAARDSIAGLGWQAWAMLILAALAGLETLLRGLSMIIRPIATRTTNTVDDRIADALDVLHDKVDALTKELGIVLPSPMTTTTVTRSTPPQPPPRRDPQAGRASTLAMLAIAFLGLGAASIGSGCAASTRESTIKTAITAVDVTASSLAAYDKDHQPEIVAQATSLEDGQAKLAAYHARRAEVRKAIAVAAAAIAVYAALNDDHSLVGMQAALKQVLVAVVALTGGSP